MAIDSLEKVRELYRPEAVVLDIPLETALEAGRFLVNNGFHSINGTTVPAELKPKTGPIQTIPHAARLLLEDPDVEFMEIVYRGVPIVGGSLVPEPPTEDEPPTPQPLPLTVADLLNGGEVDINMVNAGIVLADPAMQDRYIAGPHIVPLPDGRLSSLVGIQVWQAPGVS